MGWFGHVGCGSRLEEIIGWSSSREKKAKRTTTKRVKKSDKIHYFLWPSRARGVDKVVTDWLVDVSIRGEPLTVGPSEQQGEV